MNRRKIPWQQIYTQQTHEFQIEKTKMREQYIKDEAEFEIMDGILKDAGYGLEWIRYYRRSHAGRRFEEPLIQGATHAWRLGRINFRQCYKDNHGNRLAHDLVLRVIKNKHLIRPELSKKMNQKWGSRTFENQLYFRTDDVNYWYFIMVDPKRIKDMTDTEIWLMLSKELLTSKPKEVYSWG